MKQEVKKNKVHQINVRLDDNEYAKFKADKEKSGLSKSDFMRKIISNSTVNVRYDGKNVIREMHKVQNNINQYYHSVMNRIDVVEQRVDSLEKINILEKNTEVIVPFSINLETVACETAEIKADVLEKKAMYDKELTDCVDY